MPRKPPEPLFCALRIFCFAAQVLQARRPELRSLSFAVTAQDQESAKTRIFCPSPEAYFRGARAGMLLSQHKNRLPLEKTLRRDLVAEKEKLLELKELGQELTPAAEARASGVLLLDLTGTPLSRRFSAADCGREVQKIIQLKAGLPFSSAGLGPSGTIARILSRMAKPREVLGPPSASSTAALQAIPVNYLPGLSPLCRNKLKKFGIKAVGQLRELSLESLKGHFGGEGEKLFSLSRFLDLEPAALRAQVIETEFTVEKDTNDRRLLRLWLYRAAEKLCHGLRKKNLLTRRLVLSLTYSDNKTARRSLAFAEPTDDFLQMRESVQGLFFEAYGRRIALKKVRIWCGPFAENSGQLSLFETLGRERQARIGRALLKIREKNSFDAVLNAALMRGTLDLKKVRIMRERLRD